MNVRSQWHRLMYYGMIIVLIFTLLPISGMAQSNTLSLEGSRGVDKTEILLNEGFGITYCINPIGSYTQRKKLDLALVLDMSGSMGYRISNYSSTLRIDALKSSSRLLIQQLRNADYGDRVGIVTFETSARTVQNLTTNYNLIEQQIRSLRANGWTNIHYGMQLGQNMLRSGSNEKAIILLSDGAATHYNNGRSNVHNANVARQKIIDETIPNLQAAGIPAITIALAADGSDVDIPLLQRLARDTGGHFFRATNEAELDEVFSSLLNVLEPSIHQIRIEQPFPAGFQLMPNAPSNMTMQDQLLRIELEDIPYNYDPNHDCLIQVPLVYTGAPATYELEAATVYFHVEDQSRSITINDPITLSFFDHRIGLQGAVRTKEPMDEEKLMAWDIADALPIIYQIQPVGELIQQGSITEAKLIHLLPEGVDVANTDASLSKEKIGERQQLTFTLEDVTYRNGQFNPAQFTKEINLKFDYAAEFQLGIFGEDVRLEFVDNVGEYQVVPLINDLPTIETIVVLVDQWGNKYVGDKDGRVTRSSEDDSKQWSHQKDYENVQALAFVNDTNQAVIEVKYKNNETRLLDQRPTEPTVSILDYYNQPIEEGDKSYRRGYGTLITSDSAPSLPSETIFYGESFQSQFISDYEYKIGTDDWKTIQLKEEGYRAILTQSGSDQDIKVRAATAMIAGPDQAVKHHGDSKQRVVSLDAVPPTIPMIKVDFASNSSFYQFELEGDFTDQHSGIEENEAGEPVYHLIGEETATEKPTTEKQFTMNATQVKAGLAMIVVKDQVGNTAEALLQPPVDNTPPVIEVSITENPTDDPTITITATEEETYVRSIKVWFNDKPLDSVPNKEREYQNQKTATLQFKLSEVYSDKEERYGWHKMQIVAENTEGVKTDPPQVEYFLVNPGPQFALEAYEGTNPLNTANDDPDVANKPVTVRVNTMFTMLPNSDRYNSDSVNPPRSPVRLKSMEYAIIDSATNTAPADDDWQRLGSQQLTISTEGSHNIVWVYVRITDTENIANIEYIPVRIDYNQRRY